MLANTQGRPSDGRCSSEQQCHDEANRYRPRGAGKYLRQRFGVGAHDGRGHLVGQLVQGGRGAQRVGR
jgi:hypothetical protein